MKRLTEAAQQDRDAYERLDSRLGCSCHISPPCTICTHPGNPLNQEDDSFWEVFYTKDEALWYAICQMRRAARVLDLEAVRGGRLTAIEFKKVYDAVCERLKDLVNWQTEDVSRVTAEETLVFLGKKEDKKYLADILGAGLDQCADECEKAIDPEELTRMKKETFPDLCLTCGRAGAARQDNETGGVDICYDPWHGKIAEG